MTEINKKISRFIELSFEFTKEENELFEKDILINNNYISATTMAYENRTIPAMGRTENDNFLTKKDYNGKTKAERLESKLQIEKDKFQLLIDKANRYDEFISLRDTLQTYFKSVDKLTNG